MLLVFWTIVLIVTKEITIRTFSYRFTTLPNHVSRIVAIKTCPISLWVGSLTFGATLFDDWVAFEDCIHRLSVLPKVIQYLMDGLFLTLLKNSNVSSGCATEQNVYYLVLRESKWRDNIIIDIATNYTWYQKILPKNYTIYYISLKSCVSVTSPLAEK